ncbi:succinyldiaminopimelate aminotransferase apoenzyme [Methylobacillus rhizosphaerae]|uniref:Succinyldiaminopimelate aminotransferase apoenzyme n=1 Tax=Methylobacillus rhizosphaerae TaxID=551994 RepID=A0A238YNR4_9PROT|nr:succinyldiaminopimelate transaminase [Methylobacillus rhizosphaerae]SNR72069.1 succinyldiaminopimelate aminotransferase apoenzyme [Methylobacillus rhizosphaerae]
MNPDLNKLQPYPFQRLRDLFAGVTPNAEYAHINLSIGEPKHATPALISSALADNLAGLASYPTTLGIASLRNTIAQWLSRRYQIPALNAETEIIPVNGSREALFAFAQTVIDSSRPQPIVISPNPFYQIYEGAAFLAGAEPYFLNTLPGNDFAMEFNTVPESVLQRTQLVYVCSPGNPSGKVLTLDQWREIFSLSDRYGFVIAADECYSEIYFDETNPPLGALQAARLLGRDYTRLVVFSSLSKRSNVPGMRSGFVAGDAQLLEKFLLYRTYHGCAMNPAVQAASAAAWQDEVHVVENRRLYAEKFATVTPILQEVLDVELPDAAFYLWAYTNQSDTDFALQLYRDYNVTVLPGSFLAREAHGVNPGQGFVRIALVASLAECVEAAERIRHMLQS